jgi:hypothetical protein
MYCTAQHNADMHKFGMPYLLLLHFHSPVRSRLALPHSFLSCCLTLLLACCRYGELVRVLGLGGVVTFDYSEDPRKARLVGCDEDYVNFEGEG